MIAIPAIDLRDGIGVDPSGSDRSSVGDALTLAQDWRDAGFKRLHLTDVDAATGQGSNSELLEEILTNSPLRCQVGGGIGKIAMVERLLSKGAAAIVVGGRALEDADWLESVTGLFPGSIIVAAHVRDRRVLNRGWTAAHARLVVDVVEELNSLPLAGVMITTVNHQQDVAEIDYPLLEAVADACEFPVTAAGDIRTMMDLRALADRGLAAAVIGGALYSGAINARVVADEFGE
ncbi:MAG TPA: HisA/HisF-related TIM barrel protein [Gemmatimonadaceae bacterium]|nr:HisA/HisF-related TIM barrel protein [Gemmatimonadaceae bacterium]